jgi:hypothetical protein
VSTAKIAITIEEETLGNLDRLDSFKVFPIEARPSRKPAKKSPPGLTGSGVFIFVAFGSQPQKAGFPLALPLSCSALPKKSWVEIGQIRTLSQERLGKRKSHRGNSISPVRG